VADHRHRGAGRNGEIHVVEDGPVGVVGEAHVLEAHLGAAPFELPGAAVGDSRWVPIRPNMRSMSVRDWRISRYSTPRKLSGT
jgi:hypothetical protein